MTANIPKPDGTRVIEESTWTFQVDARRQLSERGDLN